MTKYWQMMAGILGAVCVLSAPAATVRADDAKAPERPNILWITYEDNSPNLGCYGDEYALTPNIDRLAAEGVRFTHAFATSGVCAPSRSCLITGVYPSSMGTQFMRCTGELPEFIRGFPEYLRRAGYHCTNNSKTDYNFKHSKETWDESSGRAHWRKRPRTDQPFFSVFNLTVTHESRTRLRGKAYERATKDLTPDQRRNPAKAVLPPYYPDTPEARRDWANNAELVTVMDGMAGNLLKQLEEDGLAEKTIVFVFSDHGVGLPRAKRWIYDSGIHVPLIIRIPEQFQHAAPEWKPGTVTDRLVSFVDMAPTVLSLAGIEIPSHMQGRAFLGPQAGEPREYIYAIRDRMDERYDVIRAVRDHRFKYIRNYMPHKPYAQFLDYAERGPTLQSIRALHEAGRLSGPPALFLRPEKPVEELYDTKNDPHEIHNLADDPQYRDHLERLRRVHREWMNETRDLGLIPEPDLRRRCAGTTAYELARSSQSSIPWERIRKAANLVPRGTAALPEMVQTFRTDSDPAVRYWAIVGLLALKDAAAPAKDALQGALEDESPAVRVAAAQALCYIGQERAGVPALVELLQNENEWVRLMAANALDEIGEKARPAVAAMQRAREQDENNYVIRVTNRTLNVLLGESQEIR